MDRTYPPENEAVVEVGRQKFLSQRFSVHDVTYISSTGIAHSPSLIVKPVQFVPQLPSKKQGNAVVIDESSKELIRTTVLMEILTRATDLLKLKNKTWNKGGWFGTGASPRVRKWYSMASTGVQAYNGGVGAEPLVRGSGQSP